MHLEPALISHGMHRIVHGAGRRTKYSNWYMCIYICKLPATVPQLNVASKYRVTCGG